MDVDNEIDSNLLIQFSSMGTTDKEVLISEFQKLLGHQLSADGCAFFLDMNNWNLQAAVGAYLDYEQPAAKLPVMAFVKDVTIGEGESVPPNTKFVKTWRVQNIGDEAWPPGCSLKFLNGEQFGMIDRVMVQGLQPGSVTDISVDMQSPSATGMYQGQWRMTTPTGIYFGEIIWVILQIEDHGLLGVTQAMSAFGGDVFSHPQSQSMEDNPFASPRKSDSLPSGSPNFFGSPSPSIIAQHGSAPNSPIIDPNASFASSASPTHTTQNGARIALFRNDDVFSANSASGAVSPQTDDVTDNCVDMT